jgi:hypothetical protein
VVSDSNGGKWRKKDAKDADPSEVLSVFDPRGWGGGANTAKDVQHFMPDSPECPLWEG